jgi:(2Fe-2S) ferredoxin
VLQYQLQLLFALEDEVQVIATGCFGFCEKGPIVKIMPDNTFYVQVKPEDAEEIVNEHIIKGRKVERLLYKEPSKKVTVSDSKHMEFYKKQLRIALRNCGFIDPENIEECIGRDGYSALAKCLTETTAEAVDSLVQEYFVRKAEAKGFKKGVIQHSLNTKWSEFADRSYYSYIKTLKSGMKLYRAEATNMMMEVYVLKGYIKIQSSNIILHDKTSETLKSMDAWLMSCNPLTVIGDISSTKEYNFHDYDIMLRKLGTDGIHYMISSNSDTNNQSIKATTDPSLNKQYSNEYFSIKYPTTWQIVQDDNQVTGNTTVSVQIMEKLKNDHDFRPNINIIVSKKKWSEPTSYLAQNTIAQNKQIMDSYHLLEQNDDIYINNCQGSVIDYTFNIQGYKLHGIQYIVKKKDNTTFIITATTDAARHSKQKVIANTMINSLKIK